MSNAVDEEQRKTKNSPHPRKFINGNDEQLLTITEAAEVMSVGRSCVVEAINKGELKKMFVGTHRRIPRWAIKEWQMSKTEEAFTFTKTLLAIDNKGKGR